MHIASAINPLDKSDGNVPVSVFCYNNQRRFLFVSQSYEETIERVAKGFRIQNPNSILLQTSSLLSCRGQNVIIDRSAYPFLWPFIDVIEVVITDDFVTEEDPQTERGRIVVVKPSTRSPSRAPEARPSRDTSRGAQAPYLTPSSASDPENGFQETVKNPDPLFQWDNGSQQEEKLSSLAEGNSPFSSPRKKFKAAIAHSPKKAFVENKIKDEPQETEFSTSTKSKQGSQDSVNVIRRDLRSAQIDDDSRFDVIIYGPDDQNAQFKLRGKNSVKKVLTAACKTFDLDHTRAHLVFSMEVEVDGEMQTHDFVCPPDDTMALCGINEGSKLFIKVDPISFQGHLDDDEYASD